MSLLSELHPCLHHCPSPLYPFDLIHQNTYLCRSPFCHTPAFPMALFLFYVCYSFHQHSHLCLPSLCATRFFPSCCLPYFMSVISIRITPSWMSALSVPNSCLPFKPSPLLCSFDIFHQTLMKPLGKLPYQVLLTYPTWQSTDKNSGLPVIFDVLFIICDCMLI